MHVHFVTRGGNHLVSYRQRIREPMKVLAEHGIACTSGDWIHADVHVFSKHWNPEDILHAKASPCPIFDVCDDHFGNQHGDFYREMCGIAAAVVTSSHGLAEIVERETRRRATVIHEPYEFPEGTPKNPGDPMKILWHGHAANLKALAKCLETLPANIGKLRVVCNQPIPSGMGIESYHWHLSDMPRHLEWCDVVIIPQDRFWKSPNKMVEAIRAGRFVVASDIPEYRGFGMYLGDIEKGLRWLSGQDVRATIRNAQDLIRDRFSTETIGKQWLDCILGAAKGTGMAGSTAISSAMLM